MNAQPAFAHEPQEPEDARNVLLDAAADLVQRALELDLEPQLRSRFAKLLPAPVSATGNRQPATGVAGEETIDHVLDLAAVVTALTDARARVKTPTSVQLIDRALTVMHAEFGAARSRLPVAPEAAS